MIGYFIAVIIYAIIFGIFYAIAGFEKIALAVLLLIFMEVKKTW